MLGVENINHHSSLFKMKPCVREFCVRLGVVKGHPLPAACIGLKKVCSEDERSLIFSFLFFFLYLHF